MKDFATKAIRSLAFFGGTLLAAGLHAAGTLG